MGLAGATGLALVDPTDAGWRQTRKVDLFDLAVGGEEFRNPRGGRALALDAQRQGFHPPQQQPAIERGQPRPLGVEVEGEPLVETLVVGDHGPRADVAVAAEELGGRHRTADISGTVRSDGYLVANVTGPNVSCQGIMVGWSAPPPPNQ